MYNFNDVRENEDKGFSLVELIVVIAIMAVMVAVLAPSLLQYVEKSRAQKDNSAMSEVTNAIMLAMSSQEVYDEVLYYACTQNYACYVDGPAPAEIGGKTTVEWWHLSHGHATKGRMIQFGGSVTGGNFTFSDEARQADEQQYAFAGLMQGVTITFEPEKSSNVSKYNISNAVINKAIEFRAHKTGANIPKHTDGIRPKYYNNPPDYENHGTLSTMCTSNGDMGNLYSYVRAAVGDTIELSSQTYRNSEYTVFIPIASTGGNGYQSSIQVYGQWNGTNLLATTDN